MATADTNQNTPDEAAKITREELIGLFGDHLPMAAVALITEPFPHPTITETRQALRQMAAELKSLGGVRGKLSSCSGEEIAAWEAYGHRAMLDMTEHPLHYLFLDDRTAAARGGWKAGIAWALSLLPDESSAPEPAAGA